jgi:hypothetical protein
MNNLTGDLLNVRRVAVADGFRLKGEIYNDSRGRFTDGQVILTSRILEQDGSVYITENSAYDVRSWAPN